MRNQFKDYLEVDSTEYKSFVKTLKPDFFHTEKEIDENFKAFYVISNKTNKLICGNTLNESTDELHYYIVNMPENEERGANRAVQRIVLETEEEVKGFFDAINAAMKEGKKNG